MTKRQWVGYRFSGLLALSLLPKGAK